MTPKFPAVIGYKIGFFVTDGDSLTASQLSFDRGFFRDNLWVIDSEGQEWEVFDAKILGGAGWFWGYNLFFNRRIRVQMYFRKVGTPLAHLDAGNRLLRSVRGLNRSQRTALQRQLSESVSLGDFIYMLAFHDDHFNHLKQEHPVFGPIPKGNDRSR